MFASIIFDLILTAILVAGVVLGIKNGFISTVARPIKFVGAIALALALAAPFGAVFIEPVVGPAISTKVSNVLVEKYSDITAETASAELPTLIKFAASMCGVDMSSVDTYADGTLVIEALVEKVTDPVAEIVATLVGFALVYIIAKILLGLLLHFVNEMFESGITGTANKALGATFTFLLAFCAAWAFTTLMEFFLNIPLIASAEWVQDFEGGLLYRFFKLFTPLDLLLSF